MNAVAVIFPMSPPRTVPGDFDMRAELARRRYRRRPPGLIA
jgi:hypothetical protein